MEVAVFCGFGVSRHCQLHCFCDSSRTSVRRADRLGFCLLPGAIVGEFVWDHAFKAFPGAEPIIFWTSTIGISFLWYLALSYAAIRTYRFMTRGSKPSEGHELHAFFVASLFAELHDSLLRPEPLRPAVPRNESAMPAVLQRNELDSRILRHVRSSKRDIRHERIVLRRNQQQRHARVRQNSFRARRLVILPRIAIPERRRGNFVVELAHRAHRPKAVARLSLRK